MADVNRGNRPLSPHLSIYRPQWTSIMSIAHRITGCALSLGAILVVWWLLILYVLLWFATLYLQIPGFQTSTLFSSVTVFI